MTIQAERLQILNDFDIIIEKLKNIPIDINIGQLNNVLKILSYELESTNYLFYNTSLKILSFIFR